MEQRPTSSPINEYVNGRVCILQNTYIGNLTLQRALEVIFSEAEKENPNWKETVIGKNTPNRESSARWGSLLRHQHEIHYYTISLRDQYFPNI